MKRSTLVFLGALPLIWLTPSHSTPLSVVPGEYIVQRTKDVHPPGVTAFSMRYEKKVSTTHFDVVIPHSASRRLRGLASSEEELDWTRVIADCAEIKLDPSVETCEPNIIRRLQAIPNDTDFGLQWALHDPTNDADVNAPLAWDLGTGTTSTLIGVIDSGLYRSHPDLVDNVWTNPGEPIDGVDNDGNGYIDDTFGVNTHYNISTVIDCNGHGTHVAGIIGARGNNGTGVSGVNWTTRLIAVNTDSDCGGSATTQAVIAAYDYFYDLKKNRGHNIRVLNASFGGAGASDAELRAIERLQSVDILLVAAAGNEEVDLDSVPSYPASYNVANIITVGATGPTLQRAYYSNYGDTVDIMAPGGDSSFPDGRILSTYSPDAEAGVFYAYLSGTSMATPMVTGALGLVASQRPQLTGTHLRELLLSSARSIPALNGSAAGGRFLDLASMSQAGDPVDNCPDDPNKLDPGVCGCGVTESYRDGDDDGTSDCADGCPSDGAKLAAGVCGCGLLEGDSNGDGQIECGQSIVGVRPKKPRVSVKGNRLLVSMENRVGIDYSVEVTTTKPNAARRNSSISRVYLYSSTSKELKIKKPARGVSVKVRYMFRTLSNAAIISTWSPIARVKISR